MLEVRFYGMADYLTKELHEKQVRLGHVEINAPVGTRVKRDCDFKVNLAAKDNLPDQASFDATQSILKAIKQHVHRV